LCKKNQCSADRAKVEGKNWNGSRWCKEQGESEIGALQGYYPDGVKKKSKKHEYRLAPTLTKIPNCKQKVGSQRAGRGENTRAAGKRKKKKRKKP